MPSQTLGTFHSASFADEHRSFQRWLAGRFPGVEIRRRYEEGLFGEGGPGLQRPYMIVSLVSPSVNRHNTHHAWSQLPFSLAYYALGHDDAQAAAEKLSRLEWVDRRIPLFDYSTNPPTQTQYNLRVLDASVTIQADADEDQTYNVMSDVTLEGTRSASRYVGEIIEEINYEGTARG